MYLDLSIEDTEAAKTEVRAMITNKSNKNGLPWQHVQLLVTDNDVIGLRVRKSAGSTEQRRKASNALWTFFKKRGTWGERVGRKGAARGGLKAS